MQGLLTLQNHRCNAAPTPLHSLHTHTLHTHTCAGSSLRAAFRIGTRAARSTRVDRLRSGLLPAFWAAAQNEERLAEERLAAGILGAGRVRGWGGGPGGVWGEGPGLAGSGRVGGEGGGVGGPGGMRAGRVGGGWSFIQPERVFVWHSKERAPKAGRIGNLEKSCSGLEKSCHDMEKSGKMLEKKFNHTRSLSVGRHCSSMIIGQTYKSNNFMLYKRD